MWARWLTVGVVALLMVGCSVTPSGRKQFVMLPSSQMVVMGVQSFHQIQAQTPATQDKQVDAYVQCVAKAITDLPQVREFSSDWEVVVFEDATVNAFALPGGKIGVYRGLLSVAENQDQLAAVIGHEVAHVMARHGNERVSQNLALGQSLALLNNWLDKNHADQRDKAMTLLGLGSQVGIMLPFSRLHESEADEIGQMLMARAGFDPRQASELWKNMGKDGGKAPPEFMSTHPAHDTRISDLNSGLFQTMGVYEQARASGRVPACTVAK